MPDVPLQSLVNGQQAEHISIRDRGFQYGDGCFETVRVLFNQPILWPAHFNRLQHACSVLQLSVNFEALQREVSFLLQNNSAPDVVLKIIVTRGEGGRGYSPAEQSDCTRVLQLLDYVAPNTEDGASVVLCQHRISRNTGLAGIKHLNRLDQVLASAEIPSGCDEGLCIDEEGYIIEGCRSNLLLAINSELVSPDLSMSGVEGVMLKHLIDEFSKQGIKLRSRKITLEKLKMADEVFLCNSVFGVWPLNEIQNEDWQLPKQEKPFTKGALEIHDALLRDSA